MARSGCGQARAHVRVWSEVLWQWVAPDSFGTSFLTASNRSVSEAGIALCRPTSPPSC